MIIGNKKLHNLINKLLLQELIFLFLEGSLSDWIHSERWSLMPLVVSTNIKEIGKMRLLVLAIVNMVERRNGTTQVGKFVLA